MTISTQQHVVFGTGAIGMALVEELHRRGKTVRAVNRSGRGAVPDGVEVVGGDASSVEFAKSVTADASAVYFCVNPPYTQWAELFPSIHAAVIEGAASAGAKLIVMENLYMYPPMHGEEGPDTRRTGPAPHLFVPSRHRHRSASSRPHSAVMRRRYPKRSERQSAGSVPIPRSQGE